MSAALELGFIVPHALQRLDYPFRLAIRSRSPRLCEALVNFITTAELHKGVGFGITFPLTAMVSTPDFYGIRTLIDNLFKESGGRILGFIRQNGGIELS